MALLLGAVNNVLQTGGCVCRPARAHTPFLPFSFALPALFSVPDARRLAGQTSASAGPVPLLQASPSGILVSIWWRGDGVGGLAGYEVEDEDHE